MQHFRRIGVNVALLYCSASVKVLTSSSAPSPPTHQTPLKPTSTNKETKAAITLTQQLLAPAGSVCLSVAPTITTSSPDKNGFVWSERAKDASKTLIVGAFFAAQNARHRFECDEKNLFIRHAT